MRAADHIAVLNFGELLAEGTPKEIQENKEVQNAYLGKTTDA
jgi:branched-chain amino acid transport system ATP-binding protein